VPGLAGVSVDPVRAVLIRKTEEGRAEPAGRAEGALLFTHRGVSGPVVLRLSRNLPESWSGEVAYVIQVDLLPDILPDELIAQMEGMLRAAPRKTAVNALAGLLPASLTSVVLRQAGIDAGLTAGTLPAKRVREAAERCKRLEIRIEGPARYAEAMVTAGGIAQSALNPRTMGVKDYPGLFAAGEIIDIDGDTGGYNLQAAFSTGWVAGSRAAAYINRE
jgi:predicted Rossmann fold flavoprotein